MFCYLDFRCYFEANGQNHIHFRLIQVLKNSMALHFLTFTSPSSKLEFVYPRVAESKSKCSSSRQVQHLDESKALELKSNPQVNHRTHLKDSCGSYI